MILNLKRSKWPNDTTFPGLDKERLVLLKAVWSESELPYSIAIRTNKELPEKVELKGDRTTGFGSGRPYKVVAQGIGKEIHKWSRNWNVNCYEEQ